MKKHTLLLLAVVVMASQIIAVSAIPDHPETDCYIWQGEDYFLVHLGNSSPLSIFKSLSAYQKASRSVNAAWSLGNNPSVESDEFAINYDGSVDLYFSPYPIKGVDQSNWVQVETGESWLTYFEDYDNIQRFIDSSCRVAGEERWADVYY